MNSSETTTPARQAAINGLAVVGFLALVSAGIWLAVYSTRFVPDAVNGIGSAAVYLGSLFTPKAGPQLTVVPTTSTTTISFGSATSTSATSTPPTAKPSTPVTPISARTTSTTVGGAAPVAGYGLSDLAISGTVEDGYITNRSAPAESFVPGATLPSGSLQAIRVTVRNIGTNWSGSWSVRASVSRDDAVLNQLESLAPGGERTFVIAIERMSKGSKQKITVTATSASDANADNNTAAYTVTVK